jgi:hypothetical protein
MPATLQDVREIAACLTDCKVISHNQFSCIVQAPNADQADGVQSALKYNGISAFIRKNPFTDIYYVGVCLV